ncbi:uncharacterized protein LDX57_008556 [Aspergillus melleus]|uniref:uncharacterized protein n=1 Tax=Aspergillus melleus TaxID=138277 RepID=UPI001E8D2171|nr:uncharacterized protein LDX57_008556 [Aspergillus melleus]KAH8430892.1 hypothetical protein LDX57_008556 [Aspergillus melleus]
MTVLLRKAIAGRLCHNPGMRATPPFIVAHAQNHGLARHALYRSDESMPSRSVGQSARYSIRITQHDKRGDVGLILHLIAMVRSE